MHSVLLFNFIQVLFSISTEKLWVHAMFVDIWAFKYVKKSWKKLGLKLFSNMWYNFLALIQKIVYRILGLVQIVWNLMKTLDLSHMNICKFRELTPFREFFNNFLNYSAFAKCAIFLFFHLQQKIMDTCNVF